jgi:hypothetical protein
MFENSNQKGLVFSKDSLFKVALTLALSFGLLVDIIFGNKRIPLLTLTICAIVFLYELLSPYIHSSRSKGGFS